ncbi:hypothetical protein [Streptomyces sp. NBC_00280]|uniref:hypothetical protein n=1 Tax=Streptomyces sp. NBC_00280 TaxID=2975699 RepID=UPI00324F046E
MLDQNDFTFPDDLLSARRELHETHAELRTMQADKPWSVEPSDGWDNSSSWYPSVRPATAGAPRTPRRTRLGRNAPGN